MTHADHVTVETLLTHSAFVRGLARTLVSDPEVADDAVQQAWLEACTRPPADLRSPRGWLATVTANAVRKLRRGEGRRAAREQAVARPEAVPSAAAIAEREEARRRLVDAVLALDAPYRDAVVLRYLEELPPRDVAVRLEVPVETARTRIKRGLELLRGALDSAWGGNRRAWGAALAALALGGRAHAGAGLTALAAAGVVALVAGAIGWGVATAGGRGAPSRADGGLGAPVGTARARGPDAEDAPDARPPLPALDAAGAASVVPPAGDDPAPPAPADAPARGAAAAAAEAAGVLRLRASVANATPRFGEAVELTAHFEHAGGGVVTLFTPEHLSLRPFPTWRLIGDDGRAWAPAPRMAQTMWPRGLHGDLRRIEPGGAFAHAWSADRFVGIPERGGPPDRRQSQPLPAGRYRVACTHAQPTNLLPHSAPGFGMRTESRAVPGVWTGELAAPELWITVASPTEPRLLCTQPMAAVAGGPCVVRLTVENPGRAPLPVAELRFTVHAKGSGGGEAAVSAPAILRIEPEQPLDRLEAPAGGALTIEVDLARCTFERRRGEAVTRLGLHELHPHGSLLVSASVAVGRAPDARTLAADGLWVTCAPRAAAAIPGLACTVRPLGGTRIEVRVANVSSEPRRVCTRLSWPREVSLALVPADGSGTHRAVAHTGGLTELVEDLPDGPIATRLAWDGGAYERGAPLGAADFAELAPGASLARELDLARCVHGGVPAGRYRVTATWHARVDGGHLGLPAAVTGVLASEACEVVVP